MSKIVLVLSSIVGLIALHAHAHTVLSESIPMDNAVVAVAPEEIVLGFSTAVRLTVVSIRKDGGEDRSLALPGEPSKRFVVAVSDLSPGDYLVSWRAVGADTHVVSGEFRFTVTPA